MKGAPHRVRAILGAAVALFFFAAGLPVALSGHLLLAVVPLALSGLFLLAGVLPRRRALAAASAGLVLGLSFVGVRLATVHEPAGWVVCESDRCSAAGPWWSRLLPEHASLDAGFLLSRAFFGISADEATRYAAAFDGPMRELTDVPNALVLVSGATSPRYLLREPPGDGPVAGVLFLHGFGGLSSAYLRVLERSLPPDAVLVAPALDVFARWDSERGQQVVEQTLQRLPKRVDRRRLVLVGLSNGAIFGARHAPRFAGTVLVSGVGETAGPVHVVTGAADVRVPAAWVTEAVEALRESGAQVQLDVMEGADHGLFVTSPEHWAAPARRLLEAR